MREIDVIALAKFGSFNGQLLNGTIEETHISWVILCKNLVFKIKKPIKLSFLDFHTFAKRKKYCEREVALNGKFTDIYRGMVAIRLFGNRFIVGGHKGEVVDYAVQMERLDTSKRMDLLLQKNYLQRNHVQALASVISKAHKRCPVIQGKFVLSEAKALFNDIRKEIRFIGQCAGVQHSKIIKASIQMSNVFLKRHQIRLQQRIDHGFKRDVHGDLHSANIFIYKKPVIFDCIEFNDSFRRIDVLYEIAFLCMDLEKYRKNYLAQILFSVYNKSFQCVEFPEDLAIFSYFKVLRANIRAKVHALGIRQAENDRELKFHLKELKRYLALINGYMRSDKSLLT